MTNKPFNHKIPSEIEGDLKDFPHEAIDSLFGLFTLQESNHLLWKTAKLAQCSDAVQMEEGEERMEMLNFYEAIHDLLEAAHFLYNSARSHQPFAQTLTPAH